MKPQNIKQSEIGNQILRALPLHDWKRIEAHLEPVEWPSGAIIHEAGTLVGHVAFPNSGLLSAILSSGHNVDVEIGMAGAEGLDGASAILANVPSLPRVTAQVPGDGLLLPANVFCEEWTRGEAMQHLLIHYSDVAATQTACGVMCNRLHTVEERLSRWLLLTQDFVGSDSFALANQFIAALLGVRKPGVPVALGVLQQAGLIRRTSEMIVILDRKQLEASACECYAILRDRYDRWQQTLANVPNLSNSTRLVASHGAARS